MVPWGRTAVRSLGIEVGVEVALTFVTSVARGPREPGAVVLAGFGAAGAPGVGPDPRMSLRSAAADVHSGIAVGGDRSARGVRPLRPKRPGASAACNSAPCWRPE